MSLLGTAPSSRCFGNVVVDRPAALRAKFEPKPSKELQDILDGHYQVHPEKQAIIRQILREREAADTAQEKLADQVRHERKVELDEERNDIERGANARANWAIGIAVLPLVAAAARAIREWWPT